MVVSTNSFGKKFWKIQLERGRFTGPIKALVDTLHIYWVETKA